MQLITATGDRGSIPQVCASFSERSDEEPGIQVTEVSTSSRKELMGELVPEHVQRGGAEEGWEDMGGELCHFGIKSQARLLE